MAVTESQALLVRLKNIRKTYLMDRVPVKALQDVSLEVYGSEMVAIMGPSGSGKTTLLNILGLLDSPSTGSYELVGDEVTKLPDRERSQLRNKRFGFVFQIYNLLPQLSAVDNVMIPLIYGSVPRRTRRSRAEMALEAVGLKDRISHHPSELSGGEQQRVAIARALISEPSIILADEPTGSLDSKSGAVILELIQQLHQDRKVTIILVTHDLNVAAKTERTIYLRDGIIVNRNDLEEKQTCKA